MYTLPPTSPKWYQISPWLRSFHHWLLFRLLFTPHEHLCHWGKFQWFIINVIKGRFRLDVILNFFLNKPLGKGQIILMIIQIHQKVILIQVAGSGNKGIVTSVFNCQLTTGLLFINMVGSRISTTWLWMENSFQSYSFRLKESEIIQQHNLIFTFLCIQVGLAAGWRLSSCILASLQVFAWSLFILINGNWFWTFPS